MGVAFTENSIVPDTAQSALCTFSDSPSVPVCLDLFTNESTGSKRKNKELIPVLLLGSTFGLVFGLVVVMADRLSNYILR